MGERQVDTHATKVLIFFKSTKILIVYVERIWPKRKKKIASLIKQRTAQLMKQGHTYS